MQKARRHSLRFTPLFGVLFTFPSRYWFAIGLSGVFSLTGWAPLFRAEFLVLRVTQDPTRMKTPYAYRAFTVYGRTFQSVPLRWSHAVSWSYYPGDASTTPVWAVPRSLATTCGITVVFFSYGYLDVSVPRVRLLFQDGRPSTCRVAPFGYPGIKGYLHLLRAFRSLSRPSSPPRAQASTVCPCLLSLRGTFVPG